MNDGTFNTYLRRITNGFVIIDNYKLLFCRKAVDAFRVQARIDHPISMANKKEGGVFWCKETGQ
ncbi:TylF/MycF/NovP-related O-methyltransferase [Bartonella sp. OT172YNZD]|uniref:TylF/MycF/NovP-related O-methyltransferase n=1 Tax=Bartonella sp. OT172YNZD TaxID=3243572 RepID=UPI0035CF1080